MWKWPKRGLESLVLTNLNSHNLTWDTFHNILCLSPDLVHLVVGGETTTYGWPHKSIVETQVTLPHLQTLNLTTISRDNASHILRAIHASALVDLLVTTGPDLPDLVPTLIDTSSTLRSLCISFAPHARAEKAVTAALNNAPPQLERLHLLTNTLAGSFRINEPVLEGINACRAVTTLCLERIFSTDEELIRVISRRQELQGCCDIKEIIFD
ncbi:hypothetical protein FRB94_010488 [Tulasnella sp. JGI-2019a]|nr:hypothetical protein FRB94_010488 [Tulasnella sp. JGI-2019a]KAG9017289.1 hypothetical protein FRB93_007402 [Tulasnella sp. JGI-2019a]